MRATLGLLLLGACAGGPVVTGAGTSNDGETAWFAVTEGDEVRFVRCDRNRCARVPDGPGAPAATPEPSPAPQPSSETEADDDDGRDGPDEERMDLMEGVF